MKTKHTLNAIVIAMLIAGPISVSYAGAKAKPTKIDAVATASLSKTSLNKSDAKALMQVKGMSAYKAHAIVSYRKQNGEFKSMDDLAKVKGFKRIKPEGMKSFTDQLVLE